MTMIFVLVGLLVVVLALWLVSLPANVPAYTRPIFFVVLVVLALIVGLIQLPA